jgi:hypothetical protein
MVLVDYIWILLTFSNTFDRWLYFVWSSFLVAIKDLIKDLLIYSYKMIKKFYLFYNSDQSRSLHLSSIYWSKKNERNPDPSCSSAWSTWLVHLHLFQGMPEGEKVCCKENSERCHSRMPVNIIFFICLYHSVAWFYFRQFCGYTSIDFAITM